MLGNANPETHAAGGGIGAQGPMELRNARYELRELSNPGQKAAEGAPPDKTWCALIVDCAQLGPSGEIEETEEVLSIDNGEKCFPCDENEAAAADGVGQFFSASRAPRTNSNYSIFMAHLRDAGFQFPSGVVGVGEMLNGTKCRGERVPVKDKQGAVKKNAKGYAIEQLVVAELLEALPWDATAAKGKAAAKPATKSAPASAPAPAAAAHSGNGSAVDLGSTEAEILLTIVGEAGAKGIAKAKLFNAVFEQIAASHPDLAKQKAPIAAKIASESFLKGMAAAGAVTFSGGVVKGA